MTIGLAAVDLKLRHVTTILDVRNRIRGYLEVFSKHFSNLLYSLLDLGPAYVGLLCVA